MYDNMNNREMIEWLNYWIQDADQNKKRVLIIGDSVARQYRVILNKMLKQYGYVADLIAMSYNVNEEVFFEHTEMFLRGMVKNYDCIICNVGGHHGYCINCLENVADKVMFEKRMEQYCKMLELSCKRLIIASISPENFGDEKNHNKEIEERNRILEKIASNNKYQFLDLYGAINDRKVTYIDWVHFSEADEEFVANQILKGLFQKDMPLICNRVCSIKEFISKIKSKTRIYIYGNGIRGKLIKKYLEVMDIHILSFVVSEEFYNASDDTQSISNIDVKNAFFIITPEDFALYKKLYDLKIQYISLSKNVYNFMSEYVNL